LCKRAGLRVAVLEAHDIGGGESMRTTAHVTAQPDARWKKIVKDLGAATSTQLWHEAMASIDELEQIVHELKIECDWKRVDGYLFTESEDGLPALGEELKAACSAGVSCTLSTNHELLPWRIAAALRIERQAQLDPWPFISALADFVDGNGSHVFEGSPVLEVHEDAKIRVVTGRGTVIADHAVIATHAPFTNRVLLQTKIAHYRSYAVAVSTRDPFPSGLFWDDQDPYHYIRGARIGDRSVVIVGGEDHRTGQDDDTKVHLANLEAWTAQRIVGARVEAAWSGQILEPVDGLPYIGRNSLDEKVLVATGFSGTGWAYGALAARMIRDSITGVDHTLASVLAATRITPLASAQRYVKENAQFPWQFFGGHLAKAVGEIEDLPNDAGKLIAVADKKKAAVYRDAEGGLHAFSAVCPHLGCVVDFNQLEKSWDCPCHGSRFDVHGHVLNRPAIRGLTPLEIEESDPL